MTAFERCPSTTTHTVSFGCRYVQPLLVVADVE
jgi:hypothetical protein